MLVSLLWHPAVRRVYPVSCMGLSCLTTSRSATELCLWCCGPQVGTLSHMAPEVLQEGRLSTAADVYSFGVLSEWLKTQLPALATAAATCQLGVMQDACRCCC